MGVLHTKDRALVLRAGVENLFPDVLVSFGFHVDLNQAVFVGGEVLLGNLRNGIQHSLNLSPAALDGELQSIFTLHQFCQVLRGIAGYQMTMGNDHDVIADSTYLRKNM